VFFAVGVHRGFKGAEAMPQTWKAKDAGEVTCPKWRSAFYEVHSALPHAGLGLFRLLLRM
jgi:hypothetical protein